MTDLLTLWYVYTNAQGVTSPPNNCGEARLDQDWWLGWLEGMLNTEDTIFFVTVDSTDVWSDWKLRADFERCMECGNEKLMNRDCMTPHCIAQRDEQSEFYDSINEHGDITINGATMIAGLDF